AAARSCPRPCRDPAPEPVPWWQVWRREGKRRSSERAQASLTLRNVSGCGSLPPKRDGARPAAVRCRESVALSSREQVAGLWNGLFVKRQQAPLGLSVGLDRAVMKDVADGDAAFGKAAPHQQAAMAIEWFPLRAHQTKPRARRDFEQPIKAGNIIGLDRHGLVISHVIAIEPVVARPAAERITHGRVPDPGGRERGRKRLLRKPGAETRVRPNAHIGEHIHPGTLQQRYKAFGRNV